MCSIDLLTSDECNGQQMLLKLIEILSNEEKITISLRCNIELSNLTILCKRHTTKYLKLFPVWQKACCDPFNKHTKKITNKLYTIQLLLENLIVVTINESQIMMRISLNIAPGQKLCKPCKQKIAIKENLKEKKQSQGEQDEDFLISSFKSKTQEINEELKNFNISSLKSHSNH
ncbi:ARL14 effector protein-like [Hydra vulgaris]|uniref:ARL14 effector protein-like n=1 Tax=Hydra vulgaris TaxID=6087 RepID=UPI0032EA768E